MVASGITPYGFRQSRADLLTGGLLVYPTQGNSVDRPLCL